MQVKISQAIRLISKYLKASLVPMVVGSPGCGKSAIVHQIAEQYNLKLIDLRLSQCDPTDLNV
jgi:MoxR-like ATPase